MKRISQQFQVADVWFIFIVFWLGSLLGLEDEIRRQGVPVFAAGAAIWTFPKPTIFFTFNCLDKILAYLAKRCKRTTQQPGIKSKRVYIRCLSYSVDPLLAVPQQTAAFVHPNLPLYLQWVELEWKEFVSNSDLLPRLVEHLYDQCKCLSSQIFVPQTNHEKICIWLPLCRSLVWRTDKWQILDPRLKKYLVLVTIFAGNRHIPCFGAACVTGLNIALYSASFSAFSCFLLCSN